MAQIVVQSVAQSVAQTVAKNRLQGGAARQTGGKLGAVGTESIFLHPEHT